MLDPVAFYIGGGAVHSPSDVRGLVYAATDGGTGVTQPGDFKVTALPTPGAFIRIATGSGTARSRYTGAISESYSVRGKTATDVAVTATGSGGGAVRYVIIRIKDPQFPGEPAPASIPNGPYVFPEIVSSVANLTFPYILLARIDQPLNTSTITNAMITDLRKLTRARNWPVKKLGFTSSQADCTRNDLHYWPWFQPTITIPDWATHVVGFGRVHAASQIAGPIHGQLQVRVGPNLIGPATAYDINTGASMADGARVPTLSAGIELEVPTSERGQNRVLQMFANRVGTGAAYLRADAVTQVEFDLIFEERIS